MLMGVCTRGRHNREGLSVGRAGDELSYKTLNLSFSANTDSCQQGRDSDKDKTFGKHFQVFERERQL